eukprot:2164392-Pyramimonas_sp.AAC.1
MSCGVGGGGASSSISSGSSSSTSKLSWPRCRACWCSAVSARSVPAMPAGCSFSAVPAVQPMGARQTPWAAPPPS